MSLSNAQEGPRDRRSALVKTNKPLYQQLLSGSEELDRMRNETDAVVRMILGMIADQQDSHYGGTCILGSSNKFPLWQLRRTHKRYDVRCVKCVNEPELNTIGIAYTTDPTWTDYQFDIFGQVSRAVPMGISGIKPAYENLEEFVKAMIEMFHILSKRLKLILEVA
ncbi:hypothetical protein A3C95_01120 [Candidatus Kaiserbacteria bacterium RIFCSPHIGHO2_02_FULL_56_30]|uniref:Uncharacterized protein n=1 Tax=Candidatus Kaiserbacteria bacterium RIFCSPHIGHO2_02_FULL_56_30 TaxID=1798499 RepID=A0A1F6E1X5_9BACT|nr:MAG: hypothetical protein A3C95_01120 [Candidatus Kaiserbacteria bacterium RIFCSPHIGHO2_02_FULL_56_30]